MAGFFVAGETKTRPGNYVRYENGGGVELAGVSDGVVACIFKANWGPLGEVTNVTSEAEMRKHYGNAGIPIIKAALTGGASTVKAIRVGSGGTVATLTLKDNADSSPASVLTLTAKHVGAMELALTIKTSIADSAKREAILLSGAAQLAKYTFAAGDDEAKALQDAIAADENALLVCSSYAKGSGVLAAITQAAFTAGTDPTVDNTAYSNAADALEPVEWNVLCSDSVDADVHATLSAYIKRVVDGGKLVLGVFADEVSAALTTKLTNARAFNDPSIIYIVNGAKIGTVEYTGALAAALIAGMTAATPSNQSLTHATVPNATDIIGEMTNAQIEDCINSGAIVITRSAGGSIWIEAGVNTLVNLAGNQDAGWKKIRRTKTRYELITRIRATCDPLIGKIDNDSTGRATFMAAAQGVINSMIAEGKLIDGQISEDAANPAAGDSAWFVVATNDKDSLEKTYTLYRFQFAAA